MMKILKNMFFRIEIKIVNDEKFGGTRSSVKRTDPYEFLEDDDSCWVDMSVQQLLELAYEKDLISEDRYFEYKDEEDRVISDEVLEGILELD